MEMLVKDSFNTLSNAQFEILKLFSKPMNNKDLNELKQLLEDFLSKRIDDEVDEIWEARIKSGKIRQRFEYTCETSQMKIIPNT